MQNAGFIALLITVVSVAIWFHGSTSKKIADLTRAGLLDNSRYPFAKAGGYGALVGFLFCVFSGTSEPLYLQASFIVACASGACLGMVYLVVFHAGVDADMAKAVLRTHELRQAVAPDVLQDPKELQLYLDRAYGKGRVNAKELLAARRARAERTHLIH
jgi:hypothetical protein